MSNKIHCRGAGFNCPDCKDRFSCEESTYEVSESDKFAFKMYEKYPKEAVILALGNYQQMHVEASNEAHRYKKNFETLVEWVEAEIKAAEDSAKKQTDEHFKEFFLGQKQSYERIMRQLTLFKITR